MAYYKRTCISGNLHAFGIQVLAMATLVHLLCMMANQHGTVNDILHLLTLIMKLLQ